MDLLNFALKLGDSLNFVYLTPIVGNKVSDTNGLVLDSSAEKYPLMGILLEHSHLGIVCFQVTLTIHLVIRRTPGDR
ncbi:hypothetical protein CHS0354_035599 [Potamilus streckersoni]|uniref:Uncharacterized protein n=1 Tax=Potamilus streckersoni TaxID=2493646 RepID=A0AAE0RRP9_9BIVA|nr:hypothetical protein CHS0354_035599 [Potamilus streckersoni]